MYPFLFYPILKDRLWGGDKLRSVLAKESPVGAIGESWELSGVSGDVSVVANGPLKGKTLNELILNDPVALLGKQVVDRFGYGFPILIKFIDAKLDLSIQLHPNDELARKRHNSFGKTEMWYVIDADPKARLIVGFKERVSTETYRKSLEDGTILDYLNRIPVREGDTFFIRPGLVHAIGAGILLAEIQQTSDVTYRIYDFKRKDSHGHYRELHTDLAMEAIDFKVEDDFLVSYEKDADRVNPMVDCPYFKTDFLSLTQDMTMDTTQRDSFTILMCVWGAAEVDNGSGKVSLVQGQTVLLPANTEQIHLRSAGARLLQVTL